MILRWIFNNKISISQVCSVSLAEHGACTTLWSIVSVVSTLWWSFSSWCCLLLEMMTWALCSALCTPHRQQNYSSKLTFCGWGTFITLRRNKCTHAAHVGYRCRWQWSKCGEKNICTLKLMLESFIEQLYCFAKWETYWSKCFSLVNKMLVFYVI